MGATAHIYLDTRKSKETSKGLHPVKLEVTFNREQRYYSLKEHLRKEWRALDVETYSKAMQKGEKYHDKTPRGAYRRIGEKLRNIENEANETIENMGVFSFEKFRINFFKLATDWENVFEAFEEHIKELKEFKRFGYAVSFQSTLSALKKFHGKKTLSFIDIDPKFLKKIEFWLRENDKSESTIGVYTRNIRVLFNLAINKHNVKAEYPFGSEEKGLYSPPKGEGNKRALKAEEIGLIASYKAPEGTYLEFFRDLFIFSFLANGMNIADILRLKYKNIKDGTIQFVREKTKRKAKGKKITVEITPHIQSIIDKWGNKKLSKEVYVFDVLNDNQTDAYQYYLIRQHTKLMNKYINKVAKAVGIKENISSYTARHSFATIQKNSGVPVAYLKEALGHSNVSVTENYLKGLEKEERRRIAEKLENKVLGNNLKIS